MYFEGSLREAWDEAERHADSPQNVRLPRRALQLILAAGRRGSRQ